MNKIFFLLIVLVLLNGCAQSTALLGPGIAVGTTGGNIYQATLSYGTTKTIEETTGKTPAEHVAKYVEEKNSEQKRKKIISKLVKKHIKSARKKLTLN